jgi:UDP-glucose 4-epimerase
MKILVVGTGYIGKNFATYAQNAPRYPFDSVDTTDSREEWKRKNFEGYDSVIFAAGVAHRKQTAKNAALYFEVNRDLAVAVAQKAKNANVPQFIYLSSMAVYGKKEGEISAHTKPNPRHNDNYGTSKYEAENALKNLENGSFKVAIIRPPMVYGKDCPGKFAQLKSIANFLRITPDNNNKRSMIYIDNLSEFLCAVTATGKHGIFCPQDPDYHNTAHLIKEIRRQNGKKTTIIGAARLLRLCMAIFPPARTAFGSLYYRK